MKYIKPKSLTWWGSLVPVAAGLTIATAPWHGASTLVGVIDAVTGGIEPVLLINAGLVGIGMRAAIK